MLQSVPATLERRHQTSEGVRPAGQQLSNENHCARTGSCANQDLPGNPDDPQHSAAMLQNHQRLIIGNVRDAWGMESPTMSGVRIEARPDMMDKLDSRIKDEVRALLLRLQGQRQFPVHLRPRSPQFGVKAGLPQKITAQHEVRSAKNIHLPRDTAPAMMIASDPPKPMKPPHIFGKRFVAAHLRIILKKIPAARSEHPAIRPDMRNHFLNPLRRQLDVIVKQANIVAAGGLKTGVHRTDHPDPLRGNRANRQPILDPPQDIVVRMIVFAYSNQNLGRLMGLRNK